MLERVATSGDPWIRSIKEGTDPWRNQIWALLLSVQVSSLPLSLSLSPSLALLCFSLLCCSYLLVKGLTEQANLLLNIADGKNSLSLSLSSSYPKMGRLHHSRLGCLITMISIDPEIGWLHHSRLGCLITMISINPFPYPSYPKMGRLHHSRLGCLITMISIDPEIGWLHHSRLGCLITMISINPSLILLFLLVKSRNTALGKNCCPLQVDRYSYREMFT